MASMPDKEAIRRMNRRAYVDAARGVTKVILGDDEWQIEFKVDNSMDAKKAILDGDYQLKNVCPAVIDDNVIAIRKKLAELSAKLVALYESAERAEVFWLYDKGTRSKTDEIAYEIKHIQSYGLLNERKTPLD
ncbi:hypothetical protein [Shouchella clausii]|uniref:hypothetical protein n=1 Tax=Shouchella clausii TaxID=79880 RepID=UPI0016530E09|nr:hypothetical protein [Shouchella clausii]QNM43721.1 hypothetical protein DUT88_12815 [Shouchella clausii]